MIGATISVIRLPSHRKRLFLLCFLVCFPLFFGGLYAQTSGTAARDAFIEQAKKYLGTPYRYGGTNGAGIDCSGLIYTAARESLSLNLPRTVAAMHTYADAVSDANRQPGDLVFFSVGGKVTHGGIFLGGRSFIHSASDGPYTGVIISTLDESYWKRTYIGSGRILPSGKQVADGKQVASGSQDAGGDGSNNQPKEASSSGKKNPSPGAKTSSPIQIIKPWDPPKTPLNLKLELASSLMWNFFPGDGLGLNVRGGTVQLGAIYTGFRLQPGLGVEFRFDPDTGVTQVPILLSLSLDKGFRVYTGAVFTIGTPHIPGGTEELNPGVFPGIIGLFWQTPALSYKNWGISLYQDISYTVFNSATGRDMSFASAVTAGLVFSTGVRIHFSL